jgi:hypothetical protein
VLRTGARRLRKFHREFPEETLASLEELELDFLLRFGFGVLGGAVLDLPRYGVWSFHHGDERQFRGRPSGFWEIATGHPDAGGMLQRLTEAIDGGVILKRWRVRTDPCSWQRTLDRVRFAGTWAPRHVCHDILHGCGAYVDAEPAPIAAPHRFLPTNSQMLRFVWTILGNRGGDLLRRLLYRESWGIGVSDEPVERFVADEPAPPVDWIEAEGRDFLADPLLEAGTGGRTALAELWSWQLGRGSLVRVDLQRRTREPLEMPELEGRHVSYPFSVQVGEEVWVVPETRSTGSAMRFPVDGVGQLGGARPLLERGLADPTLYYDGCRYWLFGEVEVGHLQVWHALSLDGPWTPHPLNPVVVDEGAARPAGPLFRLEGRLVRPAQDGLGGYGSAVVFREVLELSPQRYVERTIGRLDPFDPRFPDGIHTISSCGGRTVIDGKSLRIDLAQPLRKLGGRLRSGGGGGVG